MKKALLLTTILCLGIAGNCMAEEEQPEIFVEHQAETITVDDADLEASSDELFAEFVDKCFQESVEDVQAASSDNAGRYLEGNDRVAYERLKENITRIANGEETDTTSVISLEDLGIQRVYTSADLGVEDLFSGDTYQAVVAAVEEQGPDINKVVKALLADCPYEFYWFDKTAGYSYKSFDYYSVGYDWGSGEYAVTLVGNFTVSFKVAAEYAAGEYQVDPGVGTTVQSAAATAAGIVENNSSLSDRDKLSAYKDVICDMASYNNTAAAGGAQYGNPWQLIWVFDDDPDTNVTCEGYAKAFQYLYEMSHFSGIDTKSILVTGVMGGGTGQGRHMWNIVTLDGKKYIVDVTNCDEWTIGAPDKLFLKCPNYGDDPQTGYGFQCYPGDDGIVSYAFDSEMFSTYTAADLTLSLSDQKTLAVPIQSFDGAIILSDEPEFNFSFDPVANAESYQLVIRDADNEPEIISETDFNTAGSYNYSSISFNPGEALESGKLYKMAVGALSTSYGAGWPSLSTSVAVVDEDQILTLPADLTTIDEEAFSGTDAQMVIVPEDTASIGARAFSNCPNLIAVKIPSSANVDASAFEGCPDLIVVTY